MATWRRLELLFIFVILAVVANPGMTTTLEQELTPRSAPTDGFEAEILTGGKSRRQYVNVSRGYTLLIAFAKICSPCDQTRPMWDSLLAAAGRCYQRGKETRTGERLRVLALANEDVKAIREYWSDAPIFLGLGRVTNVEGFIESTGIEGVPTTILYRDGRELARLVGVPVAYGEFERVRSLISNMPACVMRGPAAGGTDRKELSPR